MSKTKGTIINKAHPEVRIPGEIVYQTEDTLNFRILGASTVNSLEVNEWIFELTVPSFESIPPGLYQDIVNNGAIEHAVTYRNTGDGWTDALNGHPADLARLKSHHAEGYLVALVRAPHPTNHIQED